MSKPQNGKPEKGKVYLVGAGPGDPELLTMRAVRLLETADVVLHDDLVSGQVLELVHPGAVVTSVGKRFGQAKVTQPEIHALMIEAARAGRSVVRLKSGDPLVFGRAGEELTALRAAAIPFEIVPGITAGLAAGAILGIPLTERTSASKLIFLTGRHAAGSADAPLWSGPLPEDATLVIYMPGRDLARIARELASAGAAHHTPCCAVSHVATAEQTHATCRLGELAGLVCGPAPLLLLIGHSLEGLLHH
jgi:uroporphyrin-III C-methyltransferase